MSHFSVLVIGDDIERQLSPYREADSNLNSKWDWYVVGGRWGGFFPLKTGERVDQARVQDVAFEGAYRARAEQAGQAFDRWARALASTDAPEPQPWAVVRASASDSNALEVYLSQPAIAEHDRLLLEERERRRVACPVTEYGFDRGAYVSKKARGALVPFAYVRDGEWRQRGQMGWFGYSIEEVPEDAWAEEVCALLASLSPDTLLTIVDCHI